MQCLEIAKHFRIIYLLYLKPEICFGLSSRFISFMLVVVVVMMCVCVGGGGGVEGGSNHMLGHILFIGRIHCTPWTITVGIFL